MSFWIAPSVFAIGVPLTIIGSTAPEALVTVRIPKITISQAKHADEDGYFIFTFQNVEPGAYEMTISAMKNGASGETSQLVGVPEGVQYVTLSEIKLPLISQKPIKPEMADLNKDGKVNIVDFSILAYYWGQPNPKKGDLNGDEIVNLKDFSLMVSRWTN